MTTPQPGSHRSISSIPKIFPCSIHSGLELSSLEIIQALWASVFPLYLGDVGGRQLTINPLKDRCLSCVHSLGIPNKAAVNVSVRVV